MIELFVHQGEFYEFLVSKIMVLCQRLIINFTNFEALAVKLLFCALFDSNMPLGQKIISIQATIKCLQPL